VVLLSVLYFQGLPLIFRIVFQKVFNSPFPQGERKEEGGLGRAYTVSTQGSLGVHVGVALRTGGGGGASTAGLAEVAAAGATGLDFAPVVAEGEAEFGGERRGIGFEVGEEVSHIQYRSNTSTIHGYVFREGRPCV